MALLSTVAENERLHSVRDVSRAKEARSLTRRLGFPPSQSLARMLNSGARMRNQVQGPMRNRGIRVNICGPEAHVPVAERKVRLVKERCRAILAGLPYRLPIKLIAYLVMFVVFCLNCIPVQAAGFSMSPREWLTGRKLNYKRDLRFEFGSYIQARTPRVVSMQPRTEGDIALLSIGNVEGTIWCVVFAFTS